MQTGRWCDWPDAGPSLQRFPDAIHSHYSTLYVQTFAHIPTIRPWFAHVGAHDISCMLTSCFRVQQESAVDGGRPFLVLVLLLQSSVSPKAVNAVMVVVAC